MVPDIDGKESDGVLGPDMERLRGEDIKDRAREPAEKRIPVLREGRCRW